MNDQKFISELFLENSQFILVGLTGRTGSGCTTTANILEGKEISFPEINSLNGFYSGLDLNRYSIVKNFAENHWENFYSIKVSDLISIYLLVLPSTKLLQFIQSCANAASKKSVLDLVKNGVLSKSLLKTNYLGVLRNLLDHNNDIDFADRRNVTFIRNCS